MQHLLLISLAVGLASGWAPAPGLQAQEQPEVKSDETTPTFSVRAQRNEVLVRVIVRDAQGKAVAGLTQDDFRLLDNGKPQKVSSFTIENNLATAAAKPAQPAAAPAEPSESEPALAPPKRYVALYFDDLVVTFEDMVRIRDAAAKFLDSSMQPDDRVGIFTSSGQGAQDFTDDRAKLRTALADLRPRSRNVGPEHDCPPLTPYEAYLITDGRDETMLNIAVLEYISCACGGDPRNCMDPKTYVESQARVAWENDLVQSRMSLRVLLNLVRRMGALPGQRTILWLSQGFLVLDLHTDVDEVVDRAVREHVVINALDSRGLWVNIPGGDASESNPLPANADPSFLATKSSYRQTGKLLNQDVMAQVSHDTGGVFIRNTNDYDGGFRKGGALSEISYLLAFSPEILKYDGKFHKLKVELVNSKGLTLQARNGYFAPNEALHPEERAKREIADAVFSRAEYREIPVELQTTFFKPSNSEAQVSALARVDAHALHFHKEGDRNLVNVKMVCAAFDRNGNFALGSERTVVLKLRDATLAHALSTGLNIRGELKLGPGTYALRVVVYEVDSAQMTALNRSIEIPYP